MERSVMDRFSHRLIAAFLTMEAWHRLRSVNFTDYLTCISIATVVFEIYIPPLYRRIRDHLLSRASGLLWRGKRKSDQPRNQAVTPATALEQPFREGPFAADIPNHVGETQIGVSPIQTERVLDSIAASPYVQNHAGGKRDGGPGPKSSRFGGGLSSVGRRLHRSRALMAFNALVYFHFAFSVGYQLLFDFPALHPVFLRWYCGLSLPLQQWK